MCIYCRQVRVPEGAVDSNSDTAELFFRPASMTIATHFILPSPALGLLFHLCCSRVEIIPETEFQAKVRNDQPGLVLETVQQNTTNT